MQKIHDITIQEQKIALRKYIKKLKSNLSPDEKRVQSLEICQQIESLPEFIEAQTIMLYWAMTDEVSFEHLIMKWYDKKKILLPCVTDDILEIRQFTGLDSMKMGPSFGILEPIGDKFTAVDEIDMVVIPGVAFDIDNNRMGRGRGYYDKFLPHTKAHKVGVCFNVQLFEQVPHDALDIKMDVVIYPQAKFTHDKIIKDIFMN